MKWSQTLFLSGAFSYSKYSWFTTADFREVSPGSRVKRTRVKFVRSTFTTVPWFPKAGVDLRRRDRQG